MFRWSNVCIWVGLAACWSSAATGANPPRPVVIESFEFLPAFAGQETATAIAINARGDFVGYFFFSGFFQEFRYLGNQARSGGINLSLRDINTAGTIIGNSFGVFPPYAILASGLDPGQTFLGSSFIDLNDRGDILEAETPSFGPIRYFRREAQSRTLLPAGVFWSGIDAEGRVFGTRFQGDNENIVFKTRFGPIVDLGSFGALGAKIRNVNSRGDIAGLTYSDGADAPPNLALAVVDGVDISVLSQTGNDSAALAVFRDGQVAGFDRGLCEPVCDGIVWVLKDNVRTNIDDALVNFLGFRPDLYDAQAASEFGWIVGTARDPRSDTFHFYRLKIEVDIDTDGDGLLDSWETRGIDSNGDGTIDFKPADFGARPDKKDIFVEIDAGDFPFPVAAGDKVVAAFAAAPVPNPDNSTGIKLHLIYDETGIGLPGATSVGGFPIGFPQTKEAHFGTVAERADPNFTNIRKAKELAVRYAVMYDGITFPLAASSGSYLGIGEIGGNDFVVDLGGRTFRDGRRDLDNKAATFMHELGHTLGLHHGGGPPEPLAKSIQAKPNYPSIMNYVLTHPLRFSERFWRLDFSREELSLLEEDFLNEIGGISSTRYRGYSMPFGVESGSGRAIRLVKLDGRSVDFNGDGRKRTSASADVNFFGSALRVSGTESASPSETLRGHNDWENLKYRIVPDAKQSEFDVEVAEGCPTNEGLEELDLAVAPPCDADFNGDNQVDLPDFFIFAEAYVRFLCVEEGGGGDRRLPLALRINDPDPQPGYCPCDLNNDDQVDDQDFVLFVAAYNEFLCP